MNLGKTLLRLPFRALGYDIVRRQKPNYTWLQELNVNTLIDIGANIGQYASEARTILPSAQIYSFEPLKSCFNQLNKTMNGDTCFKAFNCALGNELSEMQINHNEHSPASSFLKLGDLHRKHFTCAIGTKSETVSIERLDSIAESLDLKPPLMIKIDVQGFEDKVIAGGAETIRKAKVLIVETTFEELYEGQPLFDDIYEQLKELDFIYYSNNHQVLSDENCRVLQENSVFIKPDSQT